MQRCMIPGSYIMFYCHNYVKHSQFTLKLMQLLSHLFLISGHFLTAVVMNLWCTCHSALSVSLRALKSSPPLD